MIYLIKVEYKDITLLKIGYTEDNNWEKRKIQYKLHNPLCQFLFNLKGGTEVMEKSLHYKFRNYQYKEYGKEWFIGNEEILDYFKTVALKDLSNLPINPGLSKAKNKSLVKDRKVIILLDYVLRSEGREDITERDFKDMLKVVRYESTTCESIFEDLQSSNHYPSLKSKTWKEVESLLYPVLPTEIDEFFLLL